MTDSSRIDEVRAQYRHIQDVAYFNTGTYGSMAECVLQAFQAGTADFERHGLPVYQQVLDRIETVRARIAERIRGQASEISLTRNATDGVNLVVTGLDWQPGDEIIISDQEHPAMDQPWSWLAQTHGTVLKRFAVSPDPEVALANVRDVITPRTRLIGSSWVTSALGIRLPARAIAALAREHGAYSLIDGAQVFAEIDVDVQDLGSDFFTSNGHKWLCGPKGTGFLWTRLDVLQRLHPVHVGAGTFERHTRDDRGPLVPRPDGHRFEFASTTHSLWQGLAPAFDWFDHLGWDWIAARTAELAARVKEGLSTVPGVEVKSPREPERSSGLTAFAVPGHDADQLVDYLVREWRVQPRSLSMPGHVRVSTAYFNTEAEIDRLVDGVRAFLAA